MTNINSQFDGSNRRIVVFGLVMTASILAFLVWANPKDSVDEIKDIASTDKIDEVTSFRREPRKSTGENGNDGAENPIVSFGENVENYAIPELRWLVTARLLRQDQTVVAKQPVWVEEQPSPEFIMREISHEKRGEIESYATCSNELGEVSFRLFAKKSDQDNGRVLIFELKNADEVIIARARVGWPESTENGTANLGDIILINVNPALTVKARIVGGDGKVRSNTKIEVFERVNGQNRNASHGHSVYTDNEGLMSLDLFTSFADHEDRLTLDFVLDGHASVKLPTVRLSRVINVGDVVLSSLAPLVEGQVVDEEGVPIPDVHLLIYREVAGKWTLDIDRQYSSDSQGRFGIESDAPFNEFKLKPQKFGYYGEMSPVLTKGTKGLQIELRKGGFVAGRVLVDDGVPTHSIVLRLDTKPRRMSMVPDVTGRFRCTFGIPSGRYTLTCEIPGMEPLTFEGVEVSGRTTTEDPRLNPIDLRGIFVALKVRCLQENGKPIAKNMVRVVNSKRKILMRYSWTDENGYASFAIPRDKFDQTELQLLIRGFMVQSLNWPTTLSQDVTFGRVVKVIATIAGHSSNSIVRPLKLSLRSSNGSTFSGNVREGLCHMEAEPNEYSIKLLFGQIEVPFKGPKTIEISQGSKAARFAVVVDPKILAEVRKEYLDSLKH